MFRRNRPGRQHELFTCWWRGHALVGTDVAHITDEDAALVREFDGLRWYRCLRCDSWTPMAPPEAPTRERMPSRDEIDLPLRGPFLRDRYVLRLIAVDRAIHVVVLVLLALALFTFARHDAGLRKFYTDMMNDLSGGEPGVTEVRGVLGYFRNVVHYSSAHLVALGLAATAYAVLEATEGVGLWMGKRWAEYLTLVATSLLLPFEIWELSISVTTLKAVAFAINVAVVVYLLFAKRLFGLRGGQKIQRQRHLELGGWTAVDRATPHPHEVPPTPAGTAQPVGAAGGEELDEAGSEGSVAPSTQMTR